MSVSRPGPLRPPVTRDPCVVGVDVGGTKIGVVACADGALTEPSVEATETRSTAALINQILAAVRRAGGRSVATVGIGVPSIVEFDTGIVRSSVNVPLNGVALRELLRTQLGVPVFLDNDASLAALAEVHSYPPTSDRGVS